MPFQRHRIRPAARHRPETTLLYQLVDEYYPAFADQMAARGTHFPEYVQREFEDYLKCGRLEHGFLRLRCEFCHAEHLVAFSCKHRGFCPSCGARRMAESAALLVDEVLPETPMRQWVLSFPFPLRFLFASRPEIMGRVLGIVYRVLSTHLIRKAGYTTSTAHTGAVTLIQRFGGAHNLNVHFHSLTEHGQVRYSLKNPWRDGTTHVIFEPLDFIARLAALVPKPRVNLTRFHGVFAPNSQHRALITPAGRGKGRKTTTTHATQDQTPAERHAAMTWAQRWWFFWKIMMTPNTSIGRA